jgi:hypothetical protein
MGEDLQATPMEGDERSYHAPLNQFCQESGFKINNPERHAHIHPIKKTIDHWLLRQPTITTHYTNIHTKITTHIPEYGDHKDLILNLP